MPQKLYCYVDESGQDTRGRLFVVGVVVAGAERLSHTIECIVRALEGYAVADYRVTVLIDGLPAALERIVGQNMRRRGIRVRKVRGVRDEGDALIRLADAVCGLVRAAEASPEMSQLVEWGKQAGVLRDVSP